MIDKFLKFHDKHRVAFAALLAVSVFITFARND